MIKVKTDKNFTEVLLGGYIFYFSYELLIGIKNIYTNILFIKENRPFISKTTNKHINDMLKSYILKVEPVEELEDILTIIIGIKKEE